MAMRFVESDVFRAAEDAMKAALDLGGGSVHGERDLFQRFVTKKAGGNWLTCEAEVSTPGLAVFKVEGWQDDQTVFATFSVLGDGSQHVALVAEKPTFVPE